MSTIRPLATITILFVVGLLLWYRINDAPLIAPEDNSPTPGEVADSGEPALFAPGREKTGPDKSPSSVPPPPIATSPSPSDSSLPDLPELPSFDDSPALAGSSLPAATNPPSAAPAGPDLPMPTDVPFANYGNTSASDPPMSPVEGVSGRVPVLGTSTPDLTGAIDPLNADDVLLDPEPPSTPLDMAASPTLVDGEFASPSAFATARPAIDAMLGRNDLPGALRELTSWYGETSLTPDEQDEINRLLSQLAGTVIYSAEHLIAPAHIVEPGETLETIADQYQVPWQLLAKINSIANPNGVKTGDSLKVVRGPFNGVLFLGRQELALDVSGHYAGRFGVTAQGAAASEGEWVVANKLSEPGIGGEISKQLILTSTNDPATSMVVTSDANAGGFGSPFQGSVRLAPADEGDLFDILSVGSRVLVVR